MRDSFINLRNTSSLLSVRGKKLKLMNEWRKDKALLKPSRSKAYHLNKKFIVYAYSTISKKSP